MRTVDKAKQKVLLELLTVELDLGFAFANLGARQWEKVAVKDHAKAPKKR
jgi:hypothetical protein